RESVRTPMQWNDLANAGFSTAPAEALVLPVISEGDYGHATVNVERQRHDPDSLLNWLERTIRRRKECPTFGSGDCSFLDTGVPAVLAHRCHHEDVAVYAVHNFSPKPARVTLQLAEPGTGV